MARDSSARPITTLAARAMAVLLAFAACSAARADLKALFAFDGPEPFDLSAYGTDTQVFGATWDPAGHFSFDGVDDYIRVDLDLNPWLHAMPQLSIGAWARFQGSELRQYAVLSTDDGACDRQIGIENRLGGPTRWTAFPGYCPLPYEDGDPVVESERWTFLCAVYDRLAGTMRFYVDGALAYEKDAFNGGSEPFLEIGRNPLGSEYFLGDIDTVFVFEGVLSDTQVAEIHAAGREGSVDVILATEADDSERRRFEHDGFSPDPATGDVLLYPAVLASRDGVEAPLWRYTQDEPDAGWVQPAFPDDGWEHGPGGFAGQGHRSERDEPAVRDEPIDGTEPLWARGKLVLDASDLESDTGFPLALWGRWWGVLDVYINGVPATLDLGDRSSLQPERRPWADRHSNHEHYIVMSEAAAAALRPGENTIAVRVRPLATGSGRGSIYLDLGLVRNPYDGLPVSGETRLAALRPLIDESLRYCAREMVPAMSFAVVREDETYATIGIGHLDKAQQDQLPPDAVFRTASMSKPPARAAIFAMIGQGVLEPGSAAPLSLESRFWPMMEALAIDPLPGVVPDPRSQDVTLGMMIRHTSGTPDVDFGRARAEFGANPTATEQARVVYSTPWKFAPCDPGPLEWGCPPLPGDPPCRQYSNTAYFLLRHFVDQMAAEGYAGFVEAEVVRAASQGLDPLAIARERLAERSPREPWYRTREWPYDRWDSLDTWLHMTTTAEAYAQLMRRHWLLWGQPTPDFLPCHSGYPAKGGWFAGTHTAAAQRLNGDDFAAFVILTNENNREGFNQFFRTFIDTIESIDASAWDCPPDLDADGRLTIFDFLQFQNLFDAQDPIADFDGDGGF
ncbi:MAG: serine hydrolase, partial [Planctomycetota bacterium]